MTNPTATTLWRRLGQLFGGVIAISALAGCASHVPQARFTHPRDVRVSASDRVSAKVAPAAGVAIQDADRQRLAERIEAKIHSTAGPSSRPSKRYEVQVQLTRYDRGHPLARALAPGLGQMHIDGEVSLLQLPSRKKVAQFHLDKTFAWGGLYGVSTRIGALEEAFAQGVANAVCQ